MRKTSGIMGMFPLILFLLFSVTDEQAIYRTSGGVPSYGTGTGSYPQKYSTGTGNYPQGYSTGSENYQPQDYFTGTGGSSLPQGYSAGTGVSSLPQSYSTETGVSSLPQSYSTGTGVSSLPQSYSTETGVSSLPQSYSTGTGVSSLPQSYSTGTGVRSLPQSYSTGTGSGYPQQGYSTGSYAPQLYNGLNQANKQYVVNSDNVVPEGTIPRPGDASQPQYYTVKPQFVDLVNNIRKTGGEVHLKISTNPDNTLKVQMSSGGETKTFDNFPKDIFKLFTTLIKDPKLIIKTVGKVGDKLKIEVQEEPPAPENIIHVKPETLDILDSLKKGGAQVKAQIKNNKYSFTVTNENGTKTYKDIPANVGKQVIRVLKDPNLEYQVLSKTKKDALVFIPDEGGNPTTFIVPPKFLDVVNQVRKSPNSKIKIKPGNDGKYVVTINDKEYKHVEPNLLYAFVKLIREPDLQYKVTPRTDGNMKIVLQPQQKSSNVVEVTDEYLLDLITKISGDRKYKLKIEDFPNGHQLLIKHGKETKKYKVPDEFLNLITNVVKTGKPPKRHGKFAWTEDPEEDKPVSVKVDPEFIELINRVKTDPNKQYKFKVQPTDDKKYNLIFEVDGKPKKINNLPPEAIKFLIDLSKDPKSPHHVIVDQEPSEEPADEGRLIQPTESRITDRPVYPTGKEPEYPTGKEPTGTPGYPTGKEPTGTPGYPTRKEPEYPIEKEPKYPIGKKPTGRPDYPTGKEPGYPTGKEPGYPTGEEPGYPTGEEPRYPTGEEPGYPTGKKPTGTPSYPIGEEPRYPTGKTPEYPTRKEPTGTPGYPIGKEPEYPIGKEPEYPIGKEPEYPIGKKPTGRPDFPTGEEPEYPTEKEPTSRTGYPTSKEPGYPIGKEPTGRPGYPTGKEPEYPTGKEPTGRPGYPTGEEPEYPTGKEPTSRPGYPTGKEPGYPTGKEPGYPTGKEPVYPTGEEPVYPTGEEPGYPTGEKPGYPTGKEPGYPTEKEPTGRPGYPAGAEPEYPTGKEPTGRPGYPTGKEPTSRPGYPTGKEPGYPTGKEPGFPTGKEPGYPTGKEPGYPTGKEPGYPTGKEPTSRPGYPTGKEPTSRPGYPTGKEPTSRPGYPTGKEPTSRPGYPTGKEPTYRPGYPTGEEPEYPTGKEPISRPGYPTGEEPGYPTGEKPGYPTGKEPGYPTEKEPTGRPGYPTGAEPEYPTGKEPTGRPGYPTGKEPAGRPGYPTSEEPGYSTGTPGYPTSEEPRYTTGRPGYPTSDEPTGRIPSEGVAPTQPSSTKKPESTLIIPNHGNDPDTEIPTDQLELVQRVKSAPQLTLNVEPEKNDTYTVTLNDGTEVKKFPNVKPDLLHKLISARNEKNMPLEIKPGEPGNVNIHVPTADNPDTEQIEVPDDLLKPIHDIRHDPDLKINVKPDDHGTFDVTLSDGTGQKPIHNVTPEVLDLLVDIKTKPNPTFSVKSGKKPGKLNFIVPKNQKEPVTVEKTPEIIDLIKNSRKKPEPTIDIKPGKKPGTFDVDLDGKPHPGIPADVVPMIVQLTNKPDVDFEIKPGKDNTIQFVPSSPSPDTERFTVKPEVMDFIADTRKNPKAPVEIKPSKKPGTFDILVPDEKGTKKIYPDIDPDTLDLLSNLKAHPERPFSVKPTPGSDNVDILVPKPDIKEDSVPLRPHSMVLLQAIRDNPNSDMTITPQPDNSFTVNLKKGPKSKDYPNIPLNVLPLVSKIYSRPDSEIPIYPTDDGQLHGKVPQRPSESSDIPIGIDDIELVHHTKRSPNVDMHIKRNEDDDTLDVTLQKGPQKRIYPHVRPKVVNQVTKLATQPKLPYHILTGRDGQNVLSIPERKAEKPYRHVPKNVLNFLEKNRNNPGLTVDVTDSKKPNKYNVVFNDNTKPVKKVPEIDPDTAQLLVSLYSEPDLDYRTLPQKDKPDEVTVFPSSEDVPSFDVPLEPEQLLLIDDIRKPTVTDLDLMPEKDNKYTVVYNDNGRPKSSPPVDPLFANFLVRLKTEPTLPVKTFVNDKGENVANIPKRVSHNLYPNIDRNVINYLKSIKPSDRKDTRVTIRPEGNRPETYTIDLKSKTGEASFPRQPANTVQLLSQLSTQPDLGFRVLKESKGKSDVLVSVHLPYVVFRNVRPGFVHLSESIRHVPDMSVKLERRPNNEINVDVSNGNDILNVRNVRPIIAELFISLLTKHNFPYHYYLDTDGSVTLVIRKNALNPRFYDVDPEFLDYVKKLRLPQLVSATITHDDTMTYQNVDFNIEGEQPKTFKNLRPQDVQLLTLYLGYFDLPSHETIQPNGKVTVDATISARAPLYDFGLLTSKTDVIRGSQSVPEAIAESETKVVPKLELTSDDYLSPEVSSRHVPVTHTHAGFRQTLSNFKASPIRNRISLDSDVDREVGLRNKYFTGKYDDSRYVKDASSPQGSGQYYNNKRYGLYGRRNRYQSATGGNQFTTGRGIDRGSSSSYPYGSYYGPYKTPSYGL